MKTLLAVVTVVACLTATGVRAQPSTPFGGDDTGCVPDSKDHLKCSQVIGEAFGKLIAAVTGCHVKQANAAFRGSSVDEEGCETTAKGKFDGTVADVAAKCGPLVLAGSAAFESVLMASKSNPQSLDAQNAGPYCDGTADIDPSGDDAGKIPLTKDGLKCAARIAKNLAKLAGTVLRCHGRAANAGFRKNGTSSTTNAFAHEEACEMAALAKFDVGATKILPVCPPCLDMAHQDDLADNPNTGVIAQVDRVNVIIYPCPATTTTTTTSTTTTTA